ncbi:heavy metal translocating P-type ATPase [Psychroserpens ponticola]|uniref:Heavy metal translocating P-type ATPase metal-binding domain-containing protein n=1 Tax=Psychroserpens ponticola TaxID=2932268 RepID=A0ABY7RU89_9FLAO|nr:heavy metal translocating P-type ATPase metal-binding domain-containing protein [Psychroserpens ponticola]WCO00689.1 heavy metal translocating P-type ATPase metal-binding domain-containing protein [Psychroserpens ponticola]
MEQTTCFHCGDDCNTTIISFDDKNFCCNGCKTVYEIFSENDLTCYYDLQSSPGTIPKEIEGKYDFLSQETIIEKLTEFNDGNTQIATLFIPHIHCSSCIWILENLNKLNPNITSSQVNFGKKTVRVTYKSENCSLKDVVLLLSSIGYEPYISLDDFKTGKQDVNRSLIYKLGIAGFAFGNVMFLSFPEYFEVGEFWLEQYKHLFRWLMFAFSIPVVFYAGSDYFVSAYKGLRSKLLNIDVPIALGITVLFIRSTAEIIFDLGSGFFDSLTGLIFFLLLGKFFQQKTYTFLSFERDYKSYFPIAITKINSVGNETPIQVYDIEKGDRLLIRNEELIPVDGILINGKAKIDYSFVTGESESVGKESGDKLFAGGKQTSGVIEMEALKSVEQSYLTQLWSNDVFSKNKEDGFTTLTNTISKRFTYIVLSIAIIATTFWLFTDASKAMNVFTAVLIIACPCAIALSAPFTFGNLLRIFGKLKFYVKNASVIEQLAGINTIIFDKTGTITSSKSSTANYDGVALTPSEELLLKNTLRGSNHPLSRTLYDILDEHCIITLNHFEEHLGKGIEAKHNNEHIKIGSASFVGAEEPSVLNTTVHISTNNQYKGKYTFYNSYRKGLSKLFNKLKKHFDLVILSGDNEGEFENLKKLLPSKTKLIFNQKPDDKLEYIKYHQTEGAKVLMIGDGLNDAGALAQSNVGIAISENVNVFSPACDAILDATKFNQLYNFIKASKSAITIIKWSFVLSFIYNIIGLYFAVTGQLAPVVAAILMPLSSISIVVFTTITTNIIGRKLSKS